MKPLLSGIALTVLAACASPRSVGDALEIAPGDFAASAPILTGSLCLIASVIDICAPHEPAPGVVALPGAAPATPPRIAIDPVTGEASMTLRVMTWNVEGLPPPVRFGRWEALEDIGDALAAMRAQGRAPHILLVQEGFMPGAMEELIGRSGYGWIARGPQSGHDAPDSRDEAMGDSWTLRGEGVGKILGAGLYVLSDFPVTEARIRPYADCAGVDCLANKGAILARIAIPGAPEPLAVLTTHMNSQNSTHTPRARAHLAHHGQIDALERFVREGGAAGEALIFGGDFNMGASPERWSYAVPAGPVAMSQSWCMDAGAACDASALPPDAADPRAMQDLQGFHDGARVRVRPLRMELLFSEEDGAALSDHAAWLVEYRLSWNTISAAEHGEAAPFLRPSLFASSILSPAAAPAAP